MTSFGATGTVVRESILLLEQEEDTPNDFSILDVSGASATTSISDADSSITDFLERSSAHLTPYVDAKDFGDGAFPDDADEAILDYFSFCPDDEKDDVTTVQQLEERSLFDTTAKILDTQKDEVAPPGEDEKENAFFSKPCCQMSCNVAFNESAVKETRIAVIENEMTCGEHINHNHLFMLGQISALTIHEETSDAPGLEIKKRERVTVKYMFQGHNVCKKFFLFVNNCGPKRFKNLLHHYKEEGVLVNMHGNQGRTAKNATSFDRVTNIRIFMSNFSNVHGLVLPGRMWNISARNSDPDLRILPSSFTKTYVHKIYKTNCEDPVPYGTFLSMWRTFFPNVIIQKPRTDLCPLCHKNTLSFQKFALMTEDDKMTLLETSQKHLKTVMEERNHYTQLTKRIADAPQLQKSVPLSFQGTMHYSFDFAQQIFLPYDSQQVGPLYFLAPYKVGIFGVACEPLGKFVMYLIPESAAGSGKGSNTVISLVHHFMENFSVGEEHLYFHADNCAGQNKNNFLLQYGVWRTIKGLNKSFKISFLPVGHTKFAPDLYFGCFKRTYRKSSVNSLEELRQAILETCGNTIQPFIVGDEVGKMHLEFYDWQSYFKDLRAGRVTGLLENYHFETSLDVKGRLLYKTGLTSTPNSVQMFSEDTIQLILQEKSSPSSIRIQGIPLTRQIYLHEKIREYVSAECKDILCPPPEKGIEEIGAVPVVEADDDQRTHQANEENTIPIPLLDTTGNVASSSAAPEKSVQAFRLPSKVPKPTSSAKSKRRAPKCGYCGQEGHTNRVFNGVPVCPKRREDNK